MSTSKNMVESLREIVQDFLVPELKAVKVSVDALQHEMKVSHDALREQIRLSMEALRQEMKLRDEMIREEMRLRDEMHAQAMRNLGEKFDYAIDVRERLAAVEARLPRQ